MNFSLPPTNIEDAFTNKTTFGEPIGPVDNYTEEEREMYHSFAILNGRYMDLKSEVAAGKGNDEILAELATLEKDRMDYVQKYVKMMKLKKDNEPTPK